MGVLVEHGMEQSTSRTMPTKKYIVALSPEERENLESLTKKGKTTTYKLNHARILLKADINQKEGGYKDSDISEALDISIPTIERVRKRFVEQSLEAALSRQPPIQTKPRLLDGEQEAHLIALACSSTPEGQGRWTMRLLAHKMVELGYVETISHETVRQTLKKTSLSLG
jgi:transposase